MGFDKLSLTKCIKVSYYSRCYAEPVEAFLNKLNLSF